MDLVGEVVKMDCDADGKASGTFLRGRVKVAVKKPLRRGIMLKPDKNSKPEWFDMQYEKLPFYCFSCGIMGHTELGCCAPAMRNKLGKLPYDMKLRAPEEKRKRQQGFAQAAAESFCRVVWHDSLPHRKVRVRMWRRAKSNHHQRKCLLMSSRGSGLSLVNKRCPGARPRQWSQLCVRENPKMAHRRWTRFLILMCQLLSQWQ